jgi:ketosteroid isomerase-like protein
MASPGTRFAQSLAAKDESSLRGLLAPDVDFRALTPGRPWEAADADGVLRVVFGSWFEPADEIVAVLEVRDGEDVADTHAVGYRFKVRNPDGTYLVEQQAYYRCDADGRIDHLRVLCSGYRPVD